MDGYADVEYILSYQHSTHQYLRLQVFLKKKSILIENQCRFHENSQKLPVTQSYAITVKKQSNHDDISPWFADFLLVVSI